MIKGIKSQKAFTLVELLIVMAIVAILIGIAIAGIGFANMRSRNNQRLAGLGNLDKALIAFYDENSYFPSSMTQAFDDVFDDISIYLEGSWEAPGATYAYYRTDTKSVTYMICISQEQYLTSERLYTCKGSGVGKAGGNWPTNHSEVDCESPFDPVDCGSGPVIWNEKLAVWDYDFN